MCIGNCLSGMTLTPTKPAECCKILVKIGKKVQSRLSICLINRFTSFKKYFFLSPRLNLS